MPEIGDEIAAARALRRLADLLLGTAAEDIAAVEGRPVTLPG
ncbi:MAG: dsRBD fold-containing protein [Actinomycetes bacterium]